MQREKAKDQQIFFKLTIYKGHVSQQYDTSEPISARGNPVRVMTRIRLGFFRCISCRRFKMFVFGIFSIHFNNKIANLFF